MGVKTCYNKACSNQGKFNEEENGPEACRFHAGGPVFHDAYKGWSCCKKRVTDFGEFLAIPGCTAGPHNPEKSEAAPVKPDVKNTGAKEKPAFSKERDPKNYGKETYVSAPPSREKLAAQEETNDSEEVEQKCSLKAKILSSLKTELAKMELAEKNRADLTKTVQVGWPCSRSGCSETYKGEASNANCCHYHPGVPIFHEGMKFWSCCERKTSDFTAFLNQAGCEKTDNHDWVHPDEAALKSKENARYDYHQTPTNITLNVYCKGVIPKETTVHVSNKRIDIDFCFGIRKTKMSVAVSELWGKVVATSSKLNIGSTKLELIMKKKTSGTWKKLHAEEIGATVFFGMRDKKPDIWPENVVDDNGESAPAKADLKAALPKVETKASPHPFGNVKSINLKPGFGFVTFDEEEDAERALDSLERNAKLCGYRVDIKPAREDTKDVERNFERNISPQRRDTPQKRETPQRRGTSPRRDTPQRRNSPPRGLPDRRTVPDRRGNNPEKRDSVVPRVPSVRGDRGRSGGPVIRDMRRRRSRSRSRTRSRSRSRGRTRGYNRDYCLKVTNLTTRASWQDLKDFIRKETDVETAFCEAHRVKVREGLVALRTKNDMKLVLKYCDNQLINGKEVFFHEMIVDHRSISRSPVRNRRRS
ncbi:Oidioi.mRNA.OKI2018_I69.chr1.g1953.t2.cds [Oikopleura dioica]|uniref:Oidioi.mRNA.OKI2018_I69.chr1.g1953.t2.cds n=1 Tax=Oikopleura dioica TaxID=34765 RepID=A0ABN7SYP6_OIKDI|nr:Oidioi.mRNA.OKI2018_I69.chr1.g1953.t2.cds [Oikopleura dioica]